MYRPLSICSAAPSKHARTNPAPPNTRRLYGRCNRCGTIRKRSGSIVVGIGWESAATARAAKGAQVVYNCANARYHRWEEELPGIWRGILAAAQKIGARLIVATNVYAYGSVTGPMHETTAMAPVSAKGRVRATLEAEILSAGRGGTQETALVRSSDFYGPFAEGLRHTLNWYRRADTAIAATA